MTETELIHEGWKWWDMWTWRQMATAPFDPLTPMLAARRGLGLSKLSKTTKEALRALMH